MAYHLSIRLVLAATGLSSLCLPAAAQYKVVAPDGHVTYTDRPPADASLKVTPLGAARALPADSGGTVLPVELRRLSERFPVTLFTSADCNPCETGRQLLQQRGVPYTERVVASSDDVAALERTVGGRTVPSLTVGGQALRGYSQDDWTSYLDAAGYPRESRLPRGWTAPAATPLVARAPLPTPPEPAAPVVPERAATPERAAPTSPTIRF
jgi:glutaredoxin